MLEIKLSYNNFNGIISGQKVEEWNFYYIREDEYYKEDYKKAIISCLRACQKKDRSGFPVIHELTIDIYEKHEICTKRDLKYRFYRDTDDFNSDVISVFVAEKNEAYMKERKVSYKEARKMLLNLYDEVEKDDWKESEKEKEIA